MDERVAWVGSGPLLRSSPSPQSPSRPPLLRLLLPFSYSGGKGAWGARAFGGGEEEGEGEG